MRRRASAVSMSPCFQLRSSARPDLLLRHDGVHRRAGGFVANGVGLRSAAVPAGHLLHSEVLLLTPFFHGILASQLCGRRPPV